MTDKLRALTKAPELRALMEQYEAAPAADRGPILQAFNEKADALYPGWRDTIEGARRDGVLLRNAVIYCVKDVRKRDDLSEFERSNAKAAEVEFKSLFEKALKSGSLAKEDAFALAEAGQALTAAAGFDPEELRRLRRNFGQPGGKVRGNDLRKKAERWKKWVTDEVPTIRATYPTFTQEELADELIDLAKKQKIDIPERGSVI